MPCLWSKSGKSSSSLMWQARKTTKALILTQKQRPLSYFATFRERLPLTCFLSPSTQMARQVVDAFKVKNLLLVAAAVAEDSHCRQLREWLSPVCTSIIPLLEEMSTLLKMKSKLLILAFRTRVLSVRSITITGRLVLSQTRAFGTTKMLPRFAKTRLTAYPILQPS